MAVSIAREHRSPWRVRGHSRRSPMTTTTTTTSAEPRCLSLGIFLSSIRESITRHLSNPANVGRSRTFLLFSCYSRCFCFSFVPLELVVLTFAAWYLGTLAGTRGAAVLEANLSRREATGIDGLGKLKRREQRRGVVNIIFGICFAVC